MQKLSKIAVTAFVAFAFVVGSATAGAQNVVLPDNDTPTSGFGKGGTPTIGQTFVAPTDGISLQSFSFWLSNDSGLSTNPSALLFRAYIMPWDASIGVATGPALYTSGVRTGPTALSERYDFLTGGLALNPLASYVAFLSASGLFSSINGTEVTAVFESTFSGSYQDGQLVFADNGDDLSDLTATPWLLGAGIPEYEAHFEAIFGVETVVPEPTSFFLLLPALLLLGAVRKRVGNEG